MSIDEVVTWILNNPKDFKRLLPDVSEKFEQKLRSEEYYLTSINLLQNIPESISVRIKAIESLSFDFEKKESYDELLRFINFMLSIELKEGYEKDKYDKIKPKLQSYKDAIESNLNKNSNTKPLELTDFLHDEEYKDKLPQIAEKFKNSTGKKMATAIHTLLEMKVLAHKSRERKKLITTLNPNITDTSVKLIDNYLNPNTNDKNLNEKEIKKLKVWFSSLSS